jgi:hypothetical protein
VEQFRCLEQAIRIDETLSHLGLNRDLRGSLRASTGSNREDVAVPFPRGAHYVTHMTGQPNCRNRRILLTRNMALG